MTGFCTTVHLPEMKTLTIYQNGYSDEYIFQIIAVVNKQIVRTWGFFMPDRAPQSGFEKVWHDKVFWGIERLSSMLLPEKIISLEKCVK